MSKEVEFPCLVIFGSCRDGELTYAHVANNVADVEFLINSTCAAESHLDLEIIVDNLLTEGTDDLHDILCFPLNPKQMERCLVHDAYLGV